MLQLLNTAGKVIFIHTHTHTLTLAHTHTEMHTVYKGTRWTLYTSSPAYGTHVTPDTWAPEGDSVSP